MLRLDLQADTFLHHEPRAAFDDAILADGRLSHHLNELGDSAVQAIAVGEPLVEDRERLLGADHRDTMQSRNNLAAYQEMGRGANTPSRRRWGVRRRQYL